MMKICVSDLDTHIFYARSKNKGEEVVKKCTKKRKKRKKAP